MAPDFVNVRCVAQVLAWLKEKFGAGVKAGKKANFIPGNGNRRDSDVLVCVANKTFMSYPATGEPAFVEGVCFWTSDGEKIVNYPRQHLDNCTAKNGATASRFKPSIRLLKNMRNAMIEQGYINDGLAPSYFLEGCSPMFQRSTSWRAVSRRSRTTCTGFRRARPAI
ncbi:hypothetical protein [Chelativorans sp. M5D2P16]|uniref:hypothetical protein n=1 Tax=Chelativorans sp. M5D2P16 TaxID=3095678 RepID=UPI002ACA58FB|nr:hypothetical protein [Chelativorans sp. M5D2P16]MDZ5696117.1 hypothetical protein [Chelativorans sp. M5D2P16]